MDSELESVVNLLAEFKVHQLIDVNTNNDDVTLYTDGSVFGGKRPVWSFSAKIKVKSVPIRLAPTSLATKAWERWCTETWSWLVGTTITSAFIVIDF